ncbi:MAG: hypothetical protein ACJ789_19280 [Thermomicrobiales bacterium]
MSDRKSRGEEEDAETERTDVGEGERGVTSPSRGGMFGQTPGEEGDKAEDSVGGPGTTPPHRQDKV